MTSFVSPLAPIGFCLLMLEGRLARNKREDGASAVEWVIIAALVLGICIAVGGILMRAMSTKANSIETDLNAP